MNNNIDVIILTNTADDDLYKMTSTCIESIINSENEYKFNIILIESNKKTKYKYDYDNLIYIKPDIEFNYNKYLNIGLKHFKNDWLLISNNDTLYEYGWLSKMFEEYNKDSELLSLSPYNPLSKIHVDNFNTGKSVYYGYRTSYELTGWSILINKRIINIMGKFDERFPFWYQDNDYGMFLKKNKIKHGLVRNSIVKHFGGKSHRLLNVDERKRYTVGQHNKFINKWFKK